MTISEVSRGRRTLAAASPVHGSRIDPSAYIGLQRALDLESFWQSCLDLLSQARPYSICSLFFDIDDFHPRRARHHVVRSRKPGYVPATSLSVAGPYLAAHPHSRLYTYSQIVEKDPQVVQRRLEQETDEPEWDEFVQLAFWRDGHLEAILGASWDSTQSSLSSEDREYLEQLYPLIDASLDRLHALEAERVKSEGLEMALERMPLAMMMIGFDGEPMFANQHAWRQCTRWNAGLGERAAHLRLPGEIDEMLEMAAGADGDTGEAAATVRIEHPSLPGFTVAISVSWHAPGLRALPCYVVVFEDEHGDMDGSVGSERQRDQRIVSLQKLSPKERRVALMVAEGLRNVDIAERLVRSRRTIEFQLASVYRKLDIDSRTQLVKLLG